MKRSSLLSGLSVVLALVMSALPHAQAPAPRTAAQAPAPRTAAQAPARRAVRPVASHPSAAGDPTQYAALLKQYCASCHNGRANSSATASGVVFDTIDLDHVGRDAAMWERVVRKLR